MIEPDQLRLDNVGREQVLHVDIEDPTLHLLVVVVDDGLAPLGEHSYARHPPVIEGHYLVAFAEFLEDIPPLFQLLLPSRIAGEKSTAGDADDPLLGQGLLGHQELENKPSGRLGWKTGLKIKMLLRSK